MNETTAQGGDLVRRCVSRIDPGRLVERLCELIGLPSVNPFDGQPGADRGESRIARYLGHRLEQVGWQIELTEFASGRENVLARRPGQSTDPLRPSLMLAGHTDTVETDAYRDPFGAVVAEGRVHGRGACDMKAALACYLEVAEVLADQDVTLNGDLLIAGVGDEEYRQLGAKAIGASGLRTDGVIIGEPTELTICHAAKGLSAYDLTIMGRATHGSVPQHGVNAIRSAGELISALSAYESTLSMREHPLLGPGTINIGVIAGGVKANIVPAECRIQFSRRLLPSESAEGARAELIDLLGRAVDPSVWSMSDAWWVVEPYELPARNTLAITMQAAAAASDIADLAPTGFPASSDAAYFGSPVVLFGPGSLAQAHSLDEWVTVEDMVTATSVYLQAALGALTQLPTLGARR